MVDFLKDLVLVFAEALGLVSLSCLDRVESLLFVVNYVAGVTFIVLGDAAHMTLLSHYSMVQVWSVIWR